MVWRAVSCHTGAERTSKLAVDCSLCGVFRCSFLAGTRATRGDTTVDPYIFDVGLPGTFESLMGPLLYFPTLYDLTVTPRSGHLPWSPCPCPTTLSLSRLNSSVPALQAVPAVGRRLHSWPRTDPGPSNCCPHTTCYRVTAIERACSGDVRCVCVWMHVGECLHIAEQRML